MSDEKKGPFERVEQPWAVAMVSDDAPRFVDEDGLVTVRQSERGHGGGERFKVRPMPDLMAPPPRDGEPEQTLLDMLTRTDGPAKLQVELTGDQLAALARRLIDGGDAATLRALGASLARCNGPEHAHAFESLFELAAKCSEMRDAFPADVVERVLAAIAGKSGAE